MIKLGEEQLARLDRLEKLQYLDEVRKNIVGEYPELGNDRSLKDRIERAYAHAVTLGFTDGGAITQFLYYEAFAPNFYRQPAIDAWLRKPERPVEQRFADLLAQMKSKLRAD
jgi:hypothetical protein